MKYSSHSLKETEEKAQEFVLNLKPSSEATVIGLKGDLGSGKTTFTQAVAKALGVTDHITSPTFVIEKIYELKTSVFSHLIHIDAYRLEKSEELTNLGWDELIKNPKNLIFIEWPERVVGILPKNTCFLSFTFIDELTRTIEEK